MKSGLVTDVRPGTPATKSALQRGDVIQEFDGVPIRKPDDRQGHVEPASLQDSYKLVVLRNGKSPTFDVRGEVMPVSLFVGKPQAVDELADSDDNRPGLQLSELNPDDSFNSQMLQMPFGEKRQPTFSRHEALFFAWTARFRAGFFRCSIRPETRQSPFQILRRNRTRFSGILDKSQTLRIAWFRAESDTILQ